MNGLGAMHRIYGKYFRSNCLKLKRYGLMLFFLWLIPCLASAAQPLGVYAIQKDKISVSGLSSGGFMAVQMHVAFSQTFMGVGVVAGGPYFCAEGDVLNAIGRCMNDAGATLPPAIHFRDRTITEAAAGRIDPVDNLSADRIWLFTGGQDDRVFTRVMDRLNDYYQLFADGADIAYERDTVPHAQHAMITQDYGNDCDYYGSPFINDCDFDAAGALLKHIYGHLNPSTDAQADNLESFDQSQFSSSPYLGSEGYIYVPDLCQDGTTACKLHVVFHGCSQSRDELGDQYARNSGYNQWAEANGIIVLYPQTSLNATNQCWDWWGYGELGPDKRYHTRDGGQMAAVKAMVDRISGAPGPVLYCGTDTNAGHLAAERAYRWFYFFYFATGSSEYLGMSGTASNTLKESPPGNYVKVAVCP